MSTHDLVFGKGQPLIAQQAPTEISDDRVVAELPSTQASKFVKTGEFSGKSPRIWVDIDNSPHVPFFLPIIAELERQGCELILTARNTYQVCDLLDFYRMPCKVVGGHYGKSKLMRVICNCSRALQLVPTIARRRPDLAVSHGSRAQVLVSKLLGIRTVMMHDYEFSTKTGFIEPDWILMPDVIPDHLMTGRTDRVVKYTGIKEDVYVPRFTPDPHLRSQLGISDKTLLVTVRPPATEAHYHCASSDELFSATMQYLQEAQDDLRVVVLPRSTKQREQLKQDWGGLLRSGRMIISDRAWNGLNLIWFSDLVISGGGTMNREAAALGVPVYSIFGGKLGSVDKHLASTGRLVLIQHPNEVASKIQLRKWQRPASPETNNKSVLHGIIECIVSLAHGGAAECTR
jgi:uncharacterized protein